MLNLKHTLHHLIEKLCTKNRGNLMLFLILAAFFSCKKESISTTPSIEFVSITPSTVEVGKNNITITISYKDEDGDLGENNADVKNLFVTDNRNGVIYEFRIQQLSPSGSAISIQGNLSIAMPNTGITDGVNSESATFSVYLKDRAGNQSNTITTSSVTVTK